MLGKTPPPPHKFSNTCPSVKIIPVISNNAYYIRILVSQGKTTVRGEEANYLAYAIILMALKF